MTQAWTIFSIQTVPFFILVLVSMFVGFQFSPRSAGSNLIPAMLVGLLLFADLITFKKTRGWNIALLMSLALVLGFIIGGLLPIENKAEAPIVVLRTVFLLILAALSRKLAWSTFRIFRGQSLGGLMGAHPRLGRYHDHTAIVRIYPDLGGHWLIYLHGAHCRLVRET
jgi:hypothetical protein